MRKAITYAVLLVFTAAIVAALWAASVCVGMKKCNGRLYYSDSRNLFELALSTGKKETVMCLRVVGGSSKTIRHHYDVSRDNNLLAFEEDVFSASKHGVKANPVRHLIVLDQRINKRIFVYPIKNSVVFPVTLSPNGQLLAAVCCDGKGRPQLLVVRISDKKTILSGISSYNCAPTWSPDSKQLCTTNAAVHPVIIRLSDRKTDVLPIKGSALWSPNGRFILIDESDMWDMKTRRNRTVRLPDGAIAQGFSPDSEYILYTKENALKLYLAYAYDVSSGKSSLIMSNYGGSDSYPTLWRE